MSDRRGKQAVINRELFTQVGADSGALTMLAAVAHRFREPGDYVGAVLRGEEEVGSLRLRSDESSPTIQVNVDLAALAAGTRRDESECGCGDEGGKSGFVVSPSGYALFHVSGGRGGYRVRIGQLDEKAPTFDSTRLESEDLFMLTLIRPGTYSMRNTLTKAEGEIVVPYPKVSNEPYQPPAPVEINCTEKSFRPARAKVRPGQGVVWRFQGPGRIELDLIKPDDGSKPKQTSARRKRSG